MKAAVTGPGAPDVESLYRAHYRALFRLAVVFLDDSSVADDVVQEAFVRLHSGRTRPRSGKELAWLRQVVVNGCRERHRRRLVAERRTPIVDEREAGADEPVLTADTNRRITAAVDRLPTRQRECVVLHHFERLTETEIADILGISIGSIKTHLHRGRAALRPALVAEGLAPRADDRPGEALERYCATALCGGQTVGESARVDEDVRPFLVTTPIPPGSLGHSGPAEEGVDHSMEFRVIWVDGTLRVGDLPPTFADP